MSTMIETISNGSALLQLRPTAVLKNAWTNKIIETIQKSLMPQENAKDLSEIFARECAGYAYGKERGCYFNLKFIDGHFCVSDSKLQAPSDEEIDVALRQLPAHPNCIIVPACEGTYAHGFNLFYKDDEGHLRVRHFVFGINDSSKDPEKMFVVENEKHGIYVDASAFIAHTLKKNLGVLCK